LAGSLPACQEVHSGLGSNQVFDPIDYRQGALIRYHTSMTAYRTDPRIDEYIQTLPGWQQDICNQVRDLVHAADPEVTETIKRTKQPFFILNGNICALLGAKDHLNIFIYDPIAPDPEGIINQGQGNLTARAIQVRQGETINNHALLNLFKAVIANNRAGGWRKLVSKNS
jgi:hypothetical protein